MRQIVIELSIRQTTCLCMCSPTALDMAVNDRWLQLHQSSLPRANWLCLQVPNEPAHGSELCNVWFCVTQCNFVREPHIRDESKRQSLSHWMLVCLINQANKIMNMNWWNNSCTWCTEDNNSLLDFNFGSVILWHCIIFWHFHDFRHTGAILSCGIIFNDRKARFSCR